MKKNNSHPHHPLVNRRDFLAQGLIAFGATMTFQSSLAQSLLRRTNECKSFDGVSNLSPFMVFDMAGGASLPANFLVGKQGGPEDLLATYEHLGWDPRESGSLYTEFGLPMSAKYSQMLVGIVNNSSAEARKNFRMGGFCHAAQDDTSGNKMNAAPLVIQAGFKGNLITNGVGLIDSLSGGNSAPVIVNLANRPTVIGSVTDMLGAADFGGRALENFRISQKTDLAKAAIGLNEIQRADFIAQPDGQTLADLSQCAYDKSLSFLQSAAGLDPRIDPVVRSVYQIDANTSPADVNAVAATLAMNTIKGSSGPSVWTLGGCDYHDGTQTTGDLKDGEMGVQIGKAIELAYRLQRPLFFQLLTDGGTDANPGTREWRGDSGDKCMTVIGYYNPKSPPKLLRQQVGYYTDGQGAERSTLIGNEPALVGYAVLANYLNVHGMLADFRTLAPGVFSSDAQLRSVLLFDAQS